ncbi:molybdate ABC transporter substrate-binding protein [Ramlibacter solisilvae]|uniref:Molybdate ABC transporter substrate-binding protein n=1 Tax=Ramlibacter tataouinensis TaxID=94132 RepID=A0A127JNQ5_9BURK|nr:molybdate ABC transporter substrate-binding protein [Ramlibacter tataouinensis]AMO21630.1 hypothetical protein UC35_00530 [Ramlibacter tataouinensis]
MMPLTRRAFCGLAAAVPAAFAQVNTVTIAATSSLRFVLFDVIRDYQQKTGNFVHVTYGASGALFNQLKQGAPYELFLPADDEYALKLADAGLSQDRGTVYGVGRIVLYVPSGSKIRPDEDMKDLAVAARDGRLKQLAIANPQQSPYGRAAVKAMKALGVWPALENKLVLAEHSSQAAQYALSGSAHAGIVAYSLALAPTMTRGGTHVLIPERLHAPLRQRMVLTKKAGAAAKDFCNYLQSADARAVLQRYGMSLPPGK